MKKRNDMILQVDNRTSEFEISGELISRIEKYITSCLQTENFTEDVEVSLSLVGGDEIKELNSSYRGKDIVTDVLSFPSWDEYSGTLGDVVICIDRAEEQAMEIGNSLDDEIIYLVVHSIFHLLGYDHMDEEEKEIMRAKEKSALKLGKSRD